jgi:predicted nucleic acid-binding protein
VDPILVDTSAYFAILDKTDKNHNKAINFLTNNTYPLITTNIIVIETINLVNARLGHHQAIALGKKLYDKKFTTVLNITSEDEKKAWQIFQKYADKDFSLTDCSSFAVMERLKMNKVFTFDIHFIQFGKFLLVP